jgi:hypothetical protein
MGDMAPALKLTLALLLCGSIACAYLGPPPRRRVGLRVRAGVLATAMLGYVVAAVAFAAGSSAPGALAIVFAGELLCAVGWLARGEAPPADEDDGGEGGGGGGGRGPKPPPADWDAFERAFRRYARERDHQPV